MFSAPLHVPEMFRTSFMIQMRSPSWELLNQVKHKKSLKTLEQLQSDVIILDYANPVLMLIQRAFNPQTSSPDPLLDSWSSQASQKNHDLEKKLKSMLTRAGHSIFYHMKKLDDELEDLFMHNIQASWLRVDKSLFDKGPQIICFPKNVEEALLTKRAIDPSRFDERALNLTDSDFHVENQHSQNLFDQEPLSPEESMEVIEIVAVTGADSD